MLSTSGLAQSGTDPDERSLDKAFERLADQEQIQDPAESDDEVEEGHALYGDLRLLTAEVTLGVMAVGVVPLVIIGTLGFAFGANALAPGAVALTLLSLAVYGPVTSLAIVLMAPLVGILEDADPGTLLRTSGPAWLGAAVSLSAVPLLAGAAGWLALGTAPPVGNRQLAATWGSPVVQAGGPLALVLGLGGLWAGTMLAGGLAWWGLLEAEHDEENASKNSAPPTLVPAR